MFARFLASYTDNRPSSQNGSPSSVDVPGARPSKSQVLSNERLAHIYANLSNINQARTRRILLKSVSLGNAPP